MHCYMMAFIHKVMEISKEQINEISKTIDGIYSSLNSRKKLPYGNIFTFKNTKDKSIICLMTQFYDLNDSKKYEITKTKIKSCVVEIWYGNITDFKSETIDDFIENSEETELNTYRKVVTNKVNFCLIIRPATNSSLALYPSLVVY